MYVPTKSCNNDIMHFSQLVFRNIVYVTIATDLILKIYYGNINKAQCASYVTYYKLNYIFHCAVLVSIADGACLFPFPCSWFSIPHVLLLGLIPFSCVSQLFIAVISPSLIPFSWCLIPVPLSGLGTGHISML